MALVDYILLKMCNLETRRRVERTYRLQVFFTRDTKAEVVSQYKTSRVVLGRFYGEDKRLSMPRVAQSVL